MHIAAVKPKHPNIGTHEDHGCTVIAKSDPNGGEHIHCGAPAMAHFKRPIGSHAPMGGSLDLWTCELHYDQFKKATNYWTQVI